MTRKEVLRHLRARGFDAAPHAIQYALDYGRLHEPQRDGSGRFVYDQSHVERMAELLSSKEAAAT